MDSWNNINIYIHCIWVKWILYKWMDGNVDVTVGWRFHQNNYIKQILWFMNQKHHVVSNLGGNHLQLRNHENNYILNRNQAALTCVRQEFLCSRIYLPCSCRPLLFLLSPVSLISSNQRACHGRDSTLQDCWSRQSDVSGWALRSGASTIPLY